MWKLREDDPPVRDAFERRRRGLPPLVRAPKTATRELPAEPLPEPSEDTILISTEDAIRLIQTVADGDTTVSVDALIREFRRES